MNLRILTSSRIRRIVLTLGIACLLAVILSVIFVGAQNADNNLQTAASATPDASKARVAEHFGKLPLSFELNKGQTDSHVKFLSHGRGYDLFLTSTEAVLRVQKPRPPQTDKLKEQTADVREGTVLRLKMLGANATPQVEGQEELPGKVHYFVGNDPAKWRRNIPTYRRAHFKDIYPGIDVVYYGTQQELEYDYVVGPGANPKLIRFVVEGADQIRLDKKGRLLLSVQQGDVSLNKPVIYQLDENGSRREIKGTYVVNGNEVRFKLERFDSSKPLIIDPILSYSTLLGSSNTDIAMAIAVDSQGSAYVTGNTEFTGFPTTPGSFKSTPTRGGAFVTKLDPTGSSLVYSTYLNGNTNASGGNGIAVDAAGNAHVTGTTSALDFPTVNGLKTTSNFFKSTDAAATWNNQNTGLVGNVDALAVAPNAPNTIYASTSDGFYRSNDSGATWTKTPAVGITGSFVSGMAVHPTNSSIVYVGLFSGLYRSTDGGNNWNQVSTPTFGTVYSIVFDPSTPTTIYIGGGNGALKSTDNGTTWVAQNNFGVPGTPFIHSLAIDPSAPLTIYAGTLSSGVFKSTNGGSVWTAMNNGLGGPFPQGINSIVIDPANPATIYTGGSSGGINKSTNGGASWTLLTTGVPSGSVTVMVANTSGVYAAFSSTGVIRTTNGGTSWTNANVGLWSLNVHALVPHPTDGSVLLAGTGSVGTSDAFVTKLNASGSGLLFSTLLGGYGDEAGNGIAVDAGGNILVAGWTVSQNFPVANAAQEASTTKSCSSGFVSKIDPSAPSYVFSTFLRGNQCDTAYSVAVDNSSNVYVSGTTGSNDFLTLNAFQPALAGGFNSDAFVTKLTSTGSLTYSTYLGGSNGFETAYGIAADSSGNAYVTGATSSSNFPTVNPIQVGNGDNSGDVFVTKINSQGSALIYSTYLAGGRIDAGRGIAVDTAGNAYVAGFSDSVDFPLTTGALRTRSAIYKSVDGAANWSNDNYGFTGAGQTTFGGTGISSLVVHPTEPSTVYAGTGAGVFKSTNGGRTWSSMSNGLLSRGVSVLLIDPLTPSTLYALVADLSADRGVYKTTDGGATWNLRSNGIPDGELTTLAIDPVTPNTLYVGVSFFNVGGSHIFKTTDGADNWVPITQNGPLVPAALVVDPLNHLTLYSGDSATPGNTLKSTDGGTTWQSLGSTVLFARSISVSPHTPGLVYVGTDQTLFKSVDGGTNWSPVPPRTGKIVFDPVSSSTLYLLTNPSSFTAEGIFKSTDNGQTWIPVNKGLNTPQPITLAVDPQRPSNVYVGVTAPTGSDAFVTKINSAGSGLIYSTFLGGPLAPGSFINFNSQAFGIALDSSGNAYVTGNTVASGFPVTPGSYQPFIRGSSDAFISKLSTSYNISGQVLNNGATPMGGVEVVLNDGTSLSSEFTESDGSYLFLRLREGGNYTVSASTPHFTMTPASQAFNNLNSDKVQNFTAITSDSPFYTISGTVTENGHPLQGVTITLSGSQSGLRTTDINGNYSFELIVAGNYTVTPSALGFAFGPAQTFNNLSANQTANFTATRQNFVVTNTNNHGTGSLRDAIINANATIGTDTIVFNIPGSGVKTISLLIALPEITDSVVIDGTTQPGYAGTPLIELDGLALGFNSGNGLLIKAGGSTVRGLSVGNFRGSAGIAVNGCDNNVIQGNYIGVAADGTTARPNGRGIILTNAANNVIGGTTAANRNIISGNTFEGISISGKSNVVQGNFIGTNVAGTAELHNSGIGITIFDPASSGNLIGGTAAGAGNLISGNQGAGVVTAGTGTTIQGNLIGSGIL